MDIEQTSKVILISLYSLFSLIRIEYYRRAKKAGYQTVIEERRRYAIWLSVFICYEVFTFFAYLLFPESLAWGMLLLPPWLRLLGAGLGILALLWFVWIHQNLGNNLSVRLRIKDSQTLITNGPYRLVRHPMYTAFYVLHLAAFFLTANWFIGLTWTVGLTAVIFLRVNREEAMLLSRFGEEYNSYMANTGRFLPRIRVSNGKNR
ncbi:MAG: isoprenylcysteine carboxylmethyltransferase family protein [Dehalococcoidales bacterium]|nr:isoprenylcysteine carboxylmethyltransferase family protein [Dehalococcoidales bacterium]